MCRSIKTLRNFEEPPSEEEIDAAALQFVRKISGYRQPAMRNEEAFNAAVREISDATRKLLESLQPPRDGLGRTAERTRDGLGRTAERTRATSVPT